MPSLNTLGQDLVDVRHAHGVPVLNGRQWDEPQAVPAAVAASHAHLSAALEAHRTGHREVFADHLAAALLDLTALAVGLGIDLDLAADMRLEAEKRGKWVPRRYAPLAPVEQLPAMRRALAGGQMY